MTPYTRVLALAIMMAATASTAAPNDNRTASNGVAVEVTGDEYDTAKVVREPHHEVASTYSFQVLGTRSPTGLTVVAVVVAVNLISSNTVDSGKIASVTYKGGINADATLSTPVPSGCFDTRIGNLCGYRQTALVNLSEARFALAIASKDFSMRVSNTSGVSKVIVIPLEDIVAVKEASSRLSGS